jgi:hypothetical protein
MDYVYGCQQQNLSYLRQLEVDRKTLAKGITQCVAYNNRIYRQKNKNKENTPESPHTISLSKHYRNSPHDHSRFISSIFPQNSHNNLFLVHIRHVLLFRN